MVDRIKNWILRRRMIKRGESMRFEFPSEQEFAERIAKNVLDDYPYMGKTLREWINYVAENANHPIIEIDGKYYRAENPKLKTVHKLGEVVLGGFREVENGKT